VLFTKRSTERGNDAGKNDRAGCASRDLADFRPSEHAAGGGEIPFLGDDRFGGADHPEQLFPGGLNGMAALLPEAKTLPENITFAEKILIVLISSFLRKQESSLFKAFWTPAFAGVTAI
jgi:hypothetical protein